MTDPRRFVVILFTGQSTENGLCARFFEMVQEFESIAYLTAFDVGNLPGLIDLFALTAVPKLYIEDLKEGGVYRLPGAKLDLTHDFLGNLLRGVEDDSPFDEIAARRSAHRATTSDLSTDSNDRRTKIV